MHAFLAVDFEIIFNFFSMIYSEIIDNLLQMFFIILTIRVASPDLQLAATWHS